MTESLPGRAEAGDLEVSIAEMQETDWPAVSDIYAQGLATGNATFETAVPDWEYWNATRLPTCRLVARDGQGSIVGWAALSRVSRRLFQEGVAEVSIYVDVGVRGLGVGRRLLDRLIRDSEAEGIWTLQASVFPENEATIRLHEAAGFREVGRREQIAVHNGRWRDTLLLERRSDTVGTPGD